MSNAEEVEDTAVRSTRKLRVLMVCARYLPDLGGVATHVYEVVRRLSNMTNLEITILATDVTRTLPREEVIDGVSVLRVPAWPRKRDYYFAPKIASLVGQRNRWDLVHCQGIHNAVPIVAMIAARRAGIPYIVTFHTGGHSNRLRNSFRGAQWRLIGPLLRGASALIAVSRFEADTISRQAKLKDQVVTIIRNGGTLPASSAGVSAVPGRIVSSGRLERYKGHHRVIEALPHVMREIPKAHLIVLGSGQYEDELRRTAVRVGVSERVTITNIPPADRQAMADALVESSVVAALSDYEAHPIAVMEALSVGRPVVGCDIAGIGELVAEGWVRGVPPESSEARVARALVETISSPNTVSPSELPTWDACARRLGDIYLKMTRKSGPSPTVRRATTVLPDTNLFR